MPRRIELATLVRAVDPREVEAKARYGAEFLRCMIELDVLGIMRIHQHVFPPGTVPSNASEALASLHLARTASVRVPARLKRYSQRWLNERGLGGFMPDNRRER